MDPSTNVESNQYNVTINKFPGHEFVFTDINVILGANGSGKSSTLGACRTYFLLRNLKNRPGIFFSDIIR